MIPYCTNLKFEINTSPDIKITLMKHVHILLFCLISFSIYSQESFTIKTSKTFFEENKHTYLDFMLEDPNGGHILIRPNYSKGMSGLKLKGYFIEHYDKDFNLLRLLPYGSKKTKILGAFINDNKLNIIEGITDVVRMRDKTVKLISKIGDLKDFQFIENEFFSYNLNKNYGEFFEFYKEDKEDLNDKLVKFKFSENKKLFALSFHFMVGELEHHNTFTFDNEFNQVYHNETALETKNHSFEYENMIIDEEDQSTYLIGRHYPDLGIKNTRGQKMKFEIYKFNESYSKSIRLNIGKGTVTRLFPGLINGKIYFMTGYQNEENKSQKGFAFFEVNKQNLEIMKQFFIPIKQDILNNNLKGIDKLKAVFNFNLQNKDLFNFGMKNLHISKDGNFIMVAEEYYQYYVSNGQQSYVMDYHGAIMTLKFSSDGVLKNATMIHKNQRDIPKTSNYNSLASFYHNDKIHYLFNYKKRKEGKKEKDTQFNSSGKRKLNLAWVSIDNQGNVKTNDVIPYSEEGVFYMVKNAMYNEETGQLLLLGNNPKDKKKRLIELTFN